MRLTQKALTQIDTRDIRFALAQALDCSDVSIRRYIDNNDDNLTKAAAMEVIRKETGLSDEEILEKDTVVNETPNIIKGNS